jgi:hypothetical protein
VVEIWAQTLTEAGRGGIIETANPCSSVVADPAPGPGLRPAVGAGDNRPERRLVKMPPGGARAYQDTASAIVRTKAGSRNEQRAKPAYISSKGRESVQSSRQGRELYVAGPSRQPYKDEQPGGGESSRPFYIDHPITEDGYARPY